MPFEIKENNTGYLIPFNISDIPFTPKRCFFVTNNNLGDTRGNHAHINEDHFLICLGGKIKLTKENKDGVEEIILTKGKTLHQKELEWMQLDYIENNSSILVFANELYTEENYIREYKKFKEIICL